jgi:hypothetical protein
VEERSGVAFDPPAGLGEQRAKPIVDVRWRAMIGVKGDEDRARLGDDVGVVRESARAEERVLRPRPGEILGGTDGDLDDSIRVCKLKPSQRGVSRSPKR